MCKHLIGRALVVSFAAATVVGRRWLLVGKDRCVLVEGLQSTDEGFVSHRELWNIGGKIEKSAEEVDL